MWVSAVSSGVGLINQGVWGGNEYDDALSGKKACVCEE